MTRAMARGAVLGASAALAATLLLLGLRLLAGLPLPVETASDRFLPLVPVDLFLRLLGWFGGPIAAKELAYASSLVLQVLLGAAAGALLARVRRRRAGAALAVALALLWIGLLAVLWPALPASYTGRDAATALVLDAGALLLALTLMWALLTAGRSGRADRGRRTLLVAGAGVLLAAAGGAGAVTLFRRGAFGYDGLVLRGPVEPVTPNGSFYVVTKNLIDPAVDAGVWRLAVTGMVRRELRLSLDELVGTGEQRMEATLECISNGVGYGLLSNAVWAGVPLGRLLAGAVPLEGAAHVVLRGADGYTYGLPLASALRPSALVAHRMNGAALPDRHGFPARAIVPGRYGEASVKWLTDIVVTDHPVAGYYESQGWRSDFVRTMSRVDTPPAGAAVPLAAGTVTLGGVAFAGDRGISGVEVSAGGVSWEPARITYPGTPLTWALWSFDWTPPTTGDHELRVRATDGSGDVQDPERRGFAPSGASGYHARVIRVEP
jgi:DMSO/TMAO reductase YedYZ molybdopterin-dependent catalytic subunit